MIIILHGEGIVASRRKLTDLLGEAKDKEVIVLDGTKVDLGAIKQALEAKSLFGQEKLVVLENFFTGRKKEESLNYLRELPREANLIFWDGKEVGKNLLSLFSQAKIELFRPDPVLFRFLEAIQPGESQKMIALFREVLKVEEPELIFYMLVRQFRMLLGIKSGYLDGIEELPRLAPWQIKRLQNQAKFFTMERLREIYPKLLEIDFTQKTGKAPFDLGKTLEVFLTEI